MTSHPKQLLVAGLIAALGLTAFAQAPSTAPTDTPPPRVAGMGRGDPAEFQQRMQARHDQRMADLKARLKLTTAQESAWTRFTTAMQPPAAPPARPDRAEWEKLTTPQRIDRMQALHAERDTLRNRRAEATKAFYATLSTEQQKVFDAETLRHDRRHERRRGGGWGHHGYDGWR